MKKPIERLGETNISNEGYEMKIIEYNGCMDIIVEFQDEYKTKIHTQYGNFKKGEVKNPFHHSVYGIGFLGKGIYSKKNYPHIYAKWQSMLMRCYDVHTINKYPTYQDCYVCEQWHNFQNFCKWWKENYYEIEGEKMCLDKDILVKGNKIYSPETCCILPQRINLLFTKCDANRGKYPIGVYWHKASNKFIARCSIFDREDNKKQIYLGLYDTVEEAFLVYKNYKENYIKKVAYEYKELIPIELYEAMYNWTVEIND